MKKLYYLLMLTIAFNHNNIKSEEILPEEVTKATESNAESLSFEALTQRQKDLTQSAEKAEKAYETKLANFEAQKDKKKIEHKKNKASIESKFQLSMKDREESFNAMQKASQILTHAERQNQMTSYQKTNTELEQEKISALESLEKAYNLDLIALDNEYNNLLAKHDEEKIKLNNEEFELEDNFKQGIAEALTNQWKHLEAIKTNYLQSRQENQANTPKNEFHDERGYFYGSLFILQADPEDTLCSNCLDTQGNLKSNLEHHKKISQATKEVLLFATRELQHIKDGALTLIDEKNNVYAIKHGTDIRYFSKEKESNLEEIKVTEIVDSLRKSQDLSEAE